MKEPADQPPLLGTHRSIADLSARLFAPTDIAPLAAFRIAFGALMFVEMLRFFTKGWIAPLYVEPTFHFTFPGFGWVRPLPGDGMTYVFAVLTACALLIALGAYYRLAIVGFCVGFTYIFLVEAARYQNHFYLICLLSFLLIFVPAHRAASIDAWVKPAIRTDRVPAWPLWLLRGQVAIVYAFAALAKLSGDWLRGEPVRQFLAEEAPTVPFIGALLAQPWSPYLVSYGGLLLDLALIPLLLWRRTRLLALALAAAFHLTNAALFPIGIFPWLMIAALVLFVPGKWLRAIVARPGADSPPEKPASKPPSHAILVLSSLVAYFAIQILVPLRHFAYPGRASWTGEGDLFAWRMMLDRRDGTVQFTAVDPASGREWTLDPQTELADWQVATMAGRPWFVLQYAHHLRDKLRRDGYPAVQLFADYRMSLNGRPTRSVIDPSTDLAALPAGIPAADWLLPLDDP